MNTETTIHPNDEHARIAELLPWFVEGSLTPDETAEVARHLENCPLCAAEHQRCQQLNALFEAEPEPPQWSPSDAHFNRLLALIDLEEGPAVQSAPMAATIGEPRMAESSAQARDSVNTSAAVAPQPKSRDTLEALFSPQVPAPVVPEPPTPTVAPTENPRPSRSAPPPSLLQTLFAWWNRPSSLRWMVMAESFAVAALAVALVIPRVGTAPVSSPAGFETLTDAAPVAAAAGPRLRVVFDETITEREIRTLLEQAGGQFVAGPSSIGVYTVELTDAGAIAQSLSNLRRQPKVRLAEQVPAGS